MHLLSVLAGVRFWWVAAMRFNKTMEQTAICASSRWIFPCTQSNFSELRSKDQLVGAFLLRSSSV